MRLNYRYVFLMLITIYTLHAQNLSTFKFNVSNNDRGGLLGNGITDLLYKDGILYVGTGFGLSATADDGINWQNYSPDDYGGQGGVSAMAVGEDGTLWISTAYDTTADDQGLSVGGGLRYLEPGSSQWVFIPQPLDARDDTSGGKKPTTTAVQNVTFDIAVRGSDEIWISSFGGGVRRSTDRGETWEVITTDGLPFSSLDHLNHRGFAALVDTSENIWIGAVEGISKSTDGGNSWERFTHTNQTQSISGNWVIGLYHNPYDNSIWGTTLRALGETEFNAVSVTNNGGVTWTNHLVDELSDGTFVRYLAFHDSAIYAATEKGVYKTINDGENWLLLPPVRDNVTGEGLFTSTFFSVATSPAASPNHRLWVGSRDGLGSTANNGFDWIVFRSFISTRDERTDPKVYAYPNPFSPLQSDRPCRFQFDIESASQVTIDIFNFAMEKINTLQGSYQNPAGGFFDRSITWDGKDNNGRLVDNGVYFFRAKINNKVSWGKIVIIN